MKKKIGVFISYSHEDKRLVSPIVEIIRAMRKDLVFLDYDTIKKGQQWEPQLDTALAEAKMIIVFWCRHSAISEFVSREYRTAIENGKDLLPLLLDDTALRADLAKYQWIDLSTLIKHTGIMKQRVEREGLSEKQAPEIKYSTAQPVNKSKTNKFDTPNMARIMIIFALLCLIILVPGILVLYKIFSLKFIIVTSLLFLTGSISFYFLDSFQKKKKVDFREPPFQNVEKKEGDRWTSIVKNERSEPPILIDVNMVAAEEINSVLMKKIPPPDL